jgi:DDE superfamily endonuclease
MNAYLIFVIYFRSIGERFNLAKSTLSLVFFNVTDFLNQIAHSVIKFPDQREKERIMKSFKAKTKLHGVIGAVDGCYIRMKPPAERRSDYVNRKLFTSVTLQAICDDKMRYIDCFIGYPSGVHDNRIFKNSPFYQETMENPGRFSPREKILGDKAYPLESWCIPPFVDRGRLTDSQKKFNKMHASCRSVIERSFALLFGRFRRLRDINMNCADYVPVLILSACVLHNICIDSGDTSLEHYLDTGSSFIQTNVLNESETVPDHNVSQQTTGTDERNRMVLESVR